MHASRRAGFLGSALAAGLLLFPRESGAAAPPPCASGQNLVTYNSGVASGRALARTAWVGIGQDPDRVEELAGAIIALLRRTRPKRVGAADGCRVGGVIEGAVSELLVIQDTVIRQCILDGETWGALAAELYCGIAVGVGGVNLEAYLARKPVGICGTNFQQSCDATLVDAARASAECLPYIQGPFANAFARYQNNQCTY